MKKDFLNQLEKGQILIATIDEVLSATEMICAIQGQLLRIQNRSGQLLRKGEPIRLQVINLQPLQFQVFDEKGPSFRRVG